MWMIRGRQVETASGDGGGVEVVVVPARVSGRRAADDAAFAAFFDSRHHAMLRLAGLLTGSNATAEEVVQEAFVRVYERWASLEEPAAYLRVAVVNRCNSWHRRVRVARSHHSRFGLDPGVHLDRPDEMADALAQLAPRRRTVVVLRYYEHLTTAEIAEQMSISEATVRSTLHRGLAQLKEILR
jgi:RNA polymerase sigma-70 factor (sigma-E family)